MANKSFLDKVRQATWTIREAAYLVNNKNPDTSEIEISDKGSDKISSTFVWLMKEYKLGRLHPYKGSGDSAQFSPGTLMRHLKEKGHKVSGSVWKEYNQRHAQLAGSDVITEVKKTYVDAAFFVWEQYPNYTITRVARELQELPSYIPDKILDRPAVDTIRRWLTGMGPNKPGRPKKNANTAEGKLILTDIVKKLGY